ncbi:MAG: ABC transporter ATP-binding protein [Nanoarchaeota archaeon]|jgi:ABC-2 type transport system ATP-binding protein|nr:ABC transporter ATP-binding protein [Nanoarchaeota archaeon]
MKLPKFLTKKPKKKHTPLKTQEVKFSYGKQAVLQDISLEIKEASITAIIGKSGCGKSTFLKLISGIISKSHKGKIKIFGKNKTWNKNKLGFVPQELSMIPDLSIKDNINLAGLNLGISERTAMTKAKELLELLKLNEDLDKKPDELSGGQKVRLNIILSLLHNPQFLILDEPFVGLDFQNRKLLWHFLESMKKKGKAIVLTSHLLSETEEHVDRIIILKNGKVFFTGKPEKLKEKLKIKYIFEVKFAYLSKENLQQIKDNCYIKRIPILDHYDKYIMFALESENTRDQLTRLFKKLNLSYEELSLREPNLDEIFLKE